MAKCGQVNVVHSAFDVVGQMRKKYSLLELCASIKVRHATDIDTRNREWERCRYQQSYGWEFSLAHLKCLTPLSVVAVSGGRRPELTVINCTNLLAIFHAVIHYHI